MIKLKDDVRCIQFTDNSFDEIVELLGDKYMGFRTNPIVNKVVLCSPTLPYLPLLAR